MAILNNAEKLSEEELKEVEGGAILFTGRFNTPSWDLIDDQTGEVVGRVTGKDYMDGNEKVWTAARKCGVSTKELTWKEVEELRNNH